MTQALTRPRRYDLESFARAELPFLVLTMESFLTAPEKRLGTPAVEVSLRIRDIRHEWTLDVLRGVVARLDGVRERDGGIGIDVYLVAPEDIVGNNARRVGPGCSAAQVLESGAVLRLRAAKEGRNKCVAVPRCPVAEDHSFKIRQRGCIVGRLGCAISRTVRFGETHPQRARFRPVGRLSGSVRRTNRRRGHRRGPLLKLLPQRNGANGFVLPGRFSLTDCLRLIRRSGGCRM